jgi:flagellar M-ring protein FliF
MDFLNQYTSQLRDLFASMTPGARITSGLLLAVVLVSIALLFQQGTSTPDEFLFGGEPLSMSELNRMDAALAEAQLNNYKVESNRIRVPRGQKDKYIAAIASAGAMPRDFATIMADSLAKAGPLESRQQWLQRTKSARESQLSHIIGLYDWVEYATVMYEIEEHRGLRLNNRAAANVFIMPKAGESLDANRIRNLQKFVAGWHPSLQPDDVIVSGGGAAGESIDPFFDDPFMQAKDVFERDKRNEILRVLNFITGTRVEVNARFDNLREKQVVDRQPGTPAAVSEISEKESNTTTTTDGGGRPGLVANSPTRTGTDERLARENRSSTERSTSKTENKVGEVVTSELYQGYQPSEVFASVAVPRNYVLEVWRQRNPDQADGAPDENQLRAIETTVRQTVENLVQPLLPKLSAGEDKYKQVNVEIVDSIVPPPLAPPSFATTALGWASQYWTTISLLGLAGFSLLMIRSVVNGQSTPGSPAAPTLEVAGAAGHESGKHGGDGDDDDDADRPRLKLRKERSLKEDLADIVRDDPEAAAAILRTWINKAS